MFRFLLIKQIKDEDEDVIVHHSGFVTKQLIYLFLVFMPSAIKIVIDSILN